MPQARPKPVLSWGQLKKSITPMVAGEGERIPYTWYHRVNYVSGTTTQLTFFNATGVITTTNMEAAGQIPAPMYFQIHHIGIYFDLPVSILAVATGDATPALGAMNDSINLSDGVWRIEIAQKSYHKSFIWLAPPGGGPNGQLTNTGTFTATDGDQMQQATQGVPDLRNRNCFWGDITIPHNQNFSVVLDWAAAVTLNAGNTDIIAYLDGYLYRRVL